VNSHAKVGKGINKGFCMSMMCARRRVTSLVSKHLSNFEFEFWTFILDLSNIRFLVLFSQLLHPQSTTNTTPQHLPQTKKPTNPAEWCKFRFNVYFSDDKRRWFFKKQGRTCATHIGHCHLDPKQVKASSTTLDKGKYEFVLQQLQMNILIAAIQALLEKRTDTNYS
jgi:hypothetical protein